MDNLEKRIRAKLCESTTKILHQHQSEIEGIKANCFKKYQAIYGSCDDKNDSYIMIIENGFSASLLKTINLIYVLTKSDLNDLLEIQYREGINAESEYCFGQLGTLHDRFSNKISGIAKRIQSQEENGDDFVLYPSLKLEFHDKANYTQFFAEFYLKHFLALQPRLAAAKHVMRAMKIDARKMITKAESDIIFAEVN